MYFKDYDLHTNLTQLWETELSSVFESRLHNVPLGSVERNLSFHFDCLRVMASSGAHTLRLIFNERSVFPIVATRGVDEFWWPLGYMVNCAYHAPCHVDDMPQVLAHIPALYSAIPDAYFKHLVPVNEPTSRFTLPPQFEAYVADAPKKTRGNWNRLLRNSDNFGIQWTKTTLSQAVAAAESIAEGYCKHWTDRADEESFVNEAAWVNALLDIWAYSTYEDYMFCVVGVHEGRTVAVNFAYLWTDTDGCTRCNDMLCVRNMEDSYSTLSTGVLAVLHNIRSLTEVYPSHDIVYDMCVGSSGYKKQFSYAQPDATGACLVCASDVDRLIASTKHEDYVAYYAGVYQNIRQLAPLDLSRTAELITNYPFLGQL